MKQYILKIAMFFAVAAMLDFVFGAACDYMTMHAKGGTTKQLLDLCKRDKYDILVMGSSKAHHHYVPQILADSLGMNCYNAGYDGNGAVLAYGILGMMDDERLPKLLIYDVKQQFDIYDYSGDGDCSRYYQKLKKFHYEPVTKEIIGDLSENDNLKLHSGLYRYNGDLLPTIFGCMRSDAKNVNNGFAPLTGVIDSEEAQEKDYSNVISEMKISYFQKLVALAKEKGIDMVVIISPEYNTPIGDDFRPIKELCETEEVIVLDYFNDASDQNRTYFVDHCHLNEDGAALFTKQIVHDIKSNNLQSNTPHS